MNIVGAMILAFVCYYKLQLGAWWTLAVYFGLALLSLGWRH